MRSVARESSRDESVCLHGTSPLMTLIKQRMAEQLERELRGRNTMPDLAECEAIVARMLALMRRLEPPEQVRRSAAVTRAVPITLCRSPENCKWSMACAAVSQAAQRRSNVAIIRTCGREGYSALEFLWAIVPDRRWRRTRRLSGPIHREDFGHARS